MRWPTKRATMQQASLKLLTHGLFFVTSAIYIGSEGLASHTVRCNLKIPPWLLPQHLLLGALGGVHAQTRTLQGGGLVGQLLVRGLGAVIVVLVETTREVVLVGVGRDEQSDQQEGGQDDEKSGGNGGQAVGLHGEGRLSSQQRSAREGTDGGDLLLGLDLVHNGAHGSRHSAGKGQSPVVGRGLRSLVHHRLDSLVVLSINGLLRGTVHLVDVLGGTHLGDRGHGHGGRAHSGGDRGVQAGLGIGVGRGSDTGSHTNRKRGGGNEGHNGGGAPLVVKVLVGDTLHFAGDWKLKRRKKIAPP
mmetsp:Transcript_7833/g.12757  ORF Transcript_7833/g.12757 Transcript_7833/m.12757 type:complete len:302 (-) Transcript_7833:7-912(-)